VLCTVDRNFVDEDWDADDQGEASDAANKSAQQHRAEAKPSSGGSQASSTGVRADVNWLEEDFDEG
jgi:hypothetical protein